jgi:hypothetical protein
MPLLLLRRGGSPSRLDLRVLCRIEQSFPSLCINSLSLLARKISAFDIPTFDIYLVADNDETVVRKLWMMLITWRSTESKMALRSKKHDWL